MKTWNDYQIVVPSGAVGPEVFTTCPQCSPSRKKKLAKCLSVNIEKQVWHCAHCDWRGTLKSGQIDPGRKQYVRPEWPKNERKGTVERLSQERCIPMAIFESEGIVAVSAYMPQVEETVECLAFPYVKQGQLVNLKYRAVEEKAFRQIGGAEKVLYRQDHIKKDTVIITEGEFDALSCMAAGFQSVVSVPDGAPVPTAKNYQAKFTYLDQDPDPFEGVQDIVLAVDNDEPGKALRDELARRLGPERCRVVSWPTGCKDANDVLRILDANVLRECIEKARPCPVQDIVEVADTVDAVLRDYQQGLKRGLLTGWDAVDPYYTVQPGQLTILTGIPGHGKSEWLDALAVNMAELYDWHIAVCSPENSPIELHVEKFLEKFNRAPFRRGPTPRMTMPSVAVGLEWLQAHVTFIMPSDILTIDDVIQRATVLVRRKGIQGLIIDPFNEFDHKRPAGQSETEYIGLTLTKIRQWARRMQVKVWLVAHPQKLYRRDDGTYPVPTPWDISGSANWRNKADNCITVWRDEQDPTSPVRIYIQKIRYKHIGQVGMAELHWDRTTGRYTSTQTTEARHGYAD